MIDITKPVKLRCERLARVYTDKGMSKKYPLVGEAEIDADTWGIACWTKEGVHCIGEVSDFDLIQDTAIEFTTWANIYYGGVISYATKTIAQRCAAPEPLVTAVQLRINIDGNNITITQIKDES